MPVPPFCEPSPAEPPPEPPFPAALDGLRDPPLPPPVDVIELNDELLPLLWSLPPAPTVTEYDVALTDMPVAVR